jgi:hypothetical protein
MGKDPAFLFYSSDFLSGTMLMTDEQVGKYIRLLCIQHQHGHMTEKDMIKICKTYDEDIFSKFIHDADGKYYNERLDAEIGKRIAYSESRRVNRRRKSKDMINICSTHDEHMENENENINDTGIDIEKDMGVEGEKKEQPPYQAIADKWNTIVADLPKIKALTEGRKREIKSIWKLANSIDEIEVVFLAVQNSDFLCGRTDKPWTGCGFDWVMKPANWAKVIEGNYANKGSRQMTEAERIMSL